MGTGSDRIAMGTVREVGTGREIAGEQYSYSIYSPHLVVLPLGIQDT
jgi:hypothetical protein